MDSSYYYNFYYYYFLYYFYYWVETRVSRVVGVSRIPHAAFHCPKNAGHAVRRGI